MATLQIMYSAARPGTTGRCEVDRHDTKTVAPPL